ncbi:MAG: PhnD/SsuA/transferrin family substrate-binding protein [Rhodobacteraceae bacterium]|nr:PhnD/SsuA/transferrin family substrate-binding protein [Paracoccaceae bacterium]
MTAFLGMYDLPGCRSANDSFWTALRAEIGEGPARLNRESDPWQIWCDPGLIFAQTCGMPYRTRLHGRVQLIATPDYGLPGCPPGHYNSVLIAGRQAPPEAFTGGVFAYNDALSQSGWAGPMIWLSARAVRFGAHLCTGAHLASAIAVAQGRADLAGIDAMTWALIRDRPECSGLHEIARTDPTPGLPYITGPGRDAGHIAVATARAIAALPQAVRDTLHLRGLVPIPAAAYLDIPNPPAP